MNPYVGLIAGAGLLPLLTAEGIRAAGRKVVCVGFRGMFDPRLPSCCDHFNTAGFIQLGRWIRLLRSHGVEEAVMVGRVNKGRMYDPFYLVRQIPDWRAAKVWFGAAKQDRRTGALLTAVADELARSGIRLIDSTRYVPDHIAEAGVLTHIQPSARQRADIAFGLPITQRMCDLDIGQSIAVKGREVIAVEAVDGTDAMIARAGAICRSGGWTLVKMAKPTHDMRLDVPAVGPQTIANLKAAGATCLAISAGRTILVQRARVIDDADRAGIAVVGLEGTPDAGDDGEAAARPVCAEVGAAAV